MRKLKLYAEQKQVGDYILVNDVYDHYDNETFGTIYAVYAPIGSDRKVVGRLNYGIYLGDECNIKYIEVNPEYQRLGIATKMREYLAELNPDCKIVPFGNYMTDAGKKFEEKFNE